MQSRSAQINEEKDHPIKLTHIKMIHLLPRYVRNNPSTPKEIANSIEVHAAESQYLVAKAIEKIIADDPTTIVVSEGANKDHFHNQQNGEEAKQLQMTTQMAVRAFPDGIPAEFSELSKKQKECFAHISGQMILFFLKKLPAIYKSSTKKSDYVINTILERELNFFHDNLTETTRARDEKVIECVKEAAHRTGSKNVLVVFGAAHNFTFVKNDPEIALQKPIIAMTSAGLKLAQERAPKGFEEIPSIQIPPSNYYEANIQEERVRGLIQRFHFLNNSHERVAAIKALSQESREMVVQVVSSIKQINS